MESMKYAVNKFFIIFLLIVLFSISGVSATTETNNTTFTTNQVINASTTVQTYIETNHQLPQNITINNTSVTMPQFLQLSTTTILNIKANLNTNIPLKSFNYPAAPQDDMNTGNMPQTEYIRIADSVKSFMNTQGAAPEFAYGTCLGNYFSYQNMIYTYSQILNSYNTTKTLPDHITVCGWSTISNNNTKFFSIEQINNASNWVKNYIETNHQLPQNTTINGTTITMPQFLQLSTTTILT